ncbi:AMP-dependent synthetase/ligase [Streptomyces sulphureus]|uniref:AMP-dependent synthetase/ligase n=1 Tax=Streptomyces sulphureus TaxID=47758 RepID=UPI00037DE769|nr:AMP-dependent synthetase/ligase [Streptomyces sulphureus]
MQEFTVPAVSTTPHAGGLADTVFEHAERESGRVALARKDASGGWQDVTAGEFRDEVLALAKGLLSEGVRFGDRVAIMSRTRYEWTLFDYALWSIGAQPVPVYPTSSAEQVRWIMHDAEVSAAVVEHEDHAMTVGSVIGSLPKLSRLWQLNSGAVAELRERGAGLDDEVVNRHRLALTPDSVATVIYTSGTTGRPKGCLLTHANFMSEADSVLDGYGEVFAKPGEQPSLLLFLPLAHVFGRMVEVAALRGRVVLGHQPSMTADALLPDLASFRPTFIQAVPHLFEKIYRAARNKAESEGRLAPFEKAEDVAVRYAEAVEQRSFGTGPGPGTSLRMQHQLFDKLVYGKLRAAMGGRCRSAMSGGSGMERRLGLFFHGAGLPIYEGYGLTETTAAATANPPGRIRFGTVGTPLPGTSVSVASDGEVWLRGGHIFSGYLHHYQATGIALYDGWFATGDLGSLDEDGYLTLTGRKKEILVTAGGKSLSPASLEERVRASPLVAHCLVVGNDRPYVAALITLDRDAVAHWLSMRGKPELGPAELVRDADLEREIRRAVVAANTHVSKAESIRTFRVLAGQFTEDEGLLTPSLKLRRRAIEERYADEIAGLYR